MNVTDKSEKEVQLDENQFDERAPPVGDRHTAAYDYEVPDSNFLVVEEGTPVAPELRDANGDKLDDSTRVIIQKADRRGNPQPNAVLFDGRVGQFDYARMRTDSRYHKTTADGAAVDEYEHLQVFVVVPSGGNQMDTDTSRMTIGDPHTEEGEPVYLREKSELSEAQTRALNKISSNGN